MKHPKVRKDLIGCITITLIYLVLSTVQYHLDKFFPGIPIKLITNIFVGLIILLFMLEIIKVIKRKKKMHGKSKLKWIYYAPLFVLLFGILYFLSPFKLDSEKLESKVILRGCYQGNADQAVIRFRRNKNFEINWVSEAGTGEWYFGNYVQHKDTLFLVFEDKAPDKFGSIILNNGISLLAIDRPQRGKFYIMFTIGYCREIHGNTVP